MSQMAAMSRPVGEVAIPAAAPAAAPAASAVPPEYMARLRNLIAYGGGSGSYGAWNSDPTGNDGGWLDFLRKYDPSAAYVAGQSSNEGGPGQTTYSLKVDASKLPGADKGAFAFGWEGVEPGNKNMAAYNPQYVVHDPVWGDRTPAGNSVARVTGNQDKIDTLMKILGPMLVSGAAAWGAGGLNALGGLKSLGMGMPRVAEAAANRDWMSALLPFISAGAGGIGIPSWATSTGTTLARMAMPRKG